MHEHDEQIHHTDILRVGGSNRRMSRNGLAITVARSTSVDEDAILFNCLNYGRISVQYANFMLLQQVTCIAASDCATADKSNSHI